MIIGESRDSSEDSSSQSHGDYTTIQSSVVGHQSSVVGHQLDQSITGSSKNTSSPFNTGTIWSSPATLAFHPTGSTGGSSLFSGSGGGSHHYHHSHHNQNDSLRGAANAMALYKSNPYAMNGIAAITSSDLLHSGYPGEFSLSLSLSVSYFSLSLSLSLCFFSLSLSVSLSFAIEMTDQYIHHTNQYNTREPFGRKQHLLSLSHHSSFFTTLFVTLGTLFPALTPSSLRLSISRRDLSCETEIL